MPDHFQRVKKVVLSLHPAARHTETIQVAASNVVRHAVHVFVTADGRTIYGWITVNDLGDESVLVSNAQPAAMKS